MQLLENSLFLKAAHNNFYFHFSNVFSEGIKIIEGKFLDGTHFNEWCDFQQDNDFTSSVGPRKHGKTTCKVQGYLGWRLTQTVLRASPYYEIMLLSNKEELASKQISDFNRYIQVNPHYKEFQCLSSAQGIAHYRFRNKEFKVYPAGIFSAIRSLHPNEVLATDLHSDPDRKDVTIDPVEILKATNVFKRSVIHLPKEGGKLHVEGTRMSKWDVFSYTNSSDLFKHREWKAILNDAENSILFPGMWSYEKLAKLREDSPDDFEQEFQCVPIRSIRGYISSQDLDQVIDLNLQNLDFNADQGINDEVRGGYDLGKKAHPSHIAVYKWDGKGNKTEILSYWMDRTDYSYQLEIVERIIKNLKVDTLAYDNTRGELETMYEEGRLPSEMKPINFNLKTKNSMAVALGTAIRRKEVALIDDPRQTQQILNCDAELKSEQTSEGHGDSFWSNAMAIESFNEQAPRLRWL